MAFVEDDQDDRARMWAHAISALRENKADTQVLGIVVHEATWYVPLREKQPDFDDLRYWSEGGVDAVGRDLRREHVTTRSEAKKRLAHANGADEVRRVFNTMAVCAVTQDEHRRLENFAHLDGWDRYRAAGVRVRDRKDDRWLW